MNKKFKVAVLVNKNMAASIFSNDTLDFLHSFADTNDLQTLPEAMTADYMRTALHDADACITCWGTPAFTDDMFGGGLRMIAHAAGSIKNLVPKNFWNTGCRLTSNAPVIAEDVAQTTLALILCSLKNLWGFAKSTRDGQWAGGEKSRFATRRLDGLRVGVIGASHVGKEVIKILLPFKCEVVLSDPYISPIEAGNLGVKLMSLDELITTSDVVTLHAPPAETARHIINSRNAPMFKDGALFINTARGMSVDENALIKELQTGRIFACIDVTDPEPPAPDHPFRKLDNVILTPHVAGGHTVNGRHMLGDNSVREVYNFLTKGLIKYDIRREMLELMA
ncbi:MAG: hydroxyacid dehydrogenase [Treponema sp.]|nr:hydroxyacid dehydrogenase [Treponema sp.]